MNISGIFNSTYSNNVTNAKQLQRADVVSSATKTQSVQKPDVISSATKTNGGDHYFEARV
ncbi:hypothetical protein SAMN02745134_01479 [Clostridium acidisoli DSM 12555]|jgi:hypothetical protein|uniref:Uncharacterized protein n=1 Tax=Clostridium acidisoli DSM 12555 TaxID=1121291 RepID=A0A1W1XD79_9CLOT|nr:hypothetical protein [Clostridium acidisoli]SMC21886.1 hypothetical protein SAMN02745134_01479 [Clostridium acidisoli DSM 12555]